MDNVVTMSLEQYTALIKENILLRDKLAGIKRQARNNIQEQILDSRIRELSKEDTASWLNQKDDVRRLLDKFTRNYSWEWSSIASKSYVLTEDEVKQLAATEIVAQLNCHMNDILEKEELAAEAAAKMAEPKVE